MSNADGRISCPSLVSIYRQNGIFAMIGLYVDDLLLACNNTEWVVDQPPPQTSMYS
jgi:hypothetical protein